MKTAQETGSELFRKVKTSRIFGNIVSRFGLDTKTVLDVGCSEGHHLQCFGIDSVGVTIIPEHVEVGNARGLDIILGNVEDPSFDPGKKFDVIWANNIFEHLNAPHPFLVNMRGHLHPDGFMILGVPVIPNITWLSRFKKFRGAYAVSHVNFFYRKTLMETVRAGGWIVKEARLFYFTYPALDAPMNLIAPHMYVVASPNPTFTYPHKRLLSLAGYSAPSIAKQES